MELIKVRIWFKNRNGKLSKEFFTFNEVATGAATKHLESSPTELHAIAGIDLWSGYVDIKGVDIYNDDLVAAEGPWENVHHFKFPEDNYDVIEYCLKESMLVVGTHREHSHLLSSDD